MQFLNPELRKNPHKTANLFFHKLFIEKFFLLKLASSTTSSCIKVAKCNNSTKLAATYVFLFICPTKPEIKN